MGKRCEILTLNEDVWYDISSFKRVTLQMEPGSDVTIGVYGSCKMNPPTEDEIQLITTTTSSLYTLAHKVKWLKWKKVTGTSPSTVTLCGEGAVYGI